MKKISVNKNIIWSTAFVNELAANGLKFACISPGSRNTPLTLAFAKNKKIEKYVLIDERSSAFFALGLAKVKNEPVVLVSTSGTATAELYPAIIEAYKQRIPLIVCTADRAPGFFERGANQTINQQNIYANHIRFFWDMGMPQINAVKIKNVRKIAHKSIDISLYRNPGPIHLNFPFNKPFEPDAFTHQISNVINDIAQNKKSIIGSFAKNQEDFISYKKLFHNLIVTLNNFEKGIIIVGPENYMDGFHKKIVQLSEKLNYPVLADGASQLRFHTHSKKNIITNYDAFLRSEKFFKKHKPGIILHFGRTVTSKGLEYYLAKIKCQKYLINEFGDIFDPSNNTTASLKYLPSMFCDEIINRLNKKHTESKWLNSFIRADIITEKIKNKIISKAKFPIESRVITEVIDLIPEGSNIMLSNSTPIRDFDYFASNTNKKITVFNNRGASGVDGIISTAMGITKRSKKPTVLIIGDIAFYYDLNGLLQTKKNSTPLTIILINNNGGGIFRILPISKYKNVFEKYFLTPHNLNFAELTKGFGVKHTLIKKWSHFRNSFNTAIRNKNIQVLELKTDSIQSLKIREQYWDKVRQTL